MSHDLIMFIGAFFLVGGVIVLLRREHHLLTRPHDPTMDVQNHEGDR